MGAIFRIGDRFDMFLMTGMICFESSHDFYYIVNPYAPKKPDISKL